METNLNYLINKNSKSTLRGKYIGETRDYGNTNDSWTDQILTDYFVFDLVNSYNLFDTYKIQMGINNIFDENYQQAHEYSTMGRVLKFAIKKIY